MFSARAFAILISLILTFEIHRSLVKSAHDQEGKVSKEQTEENDPLVQEYGHVVFSSMLFRHGARNRVFKYPKHENEDFYKERGWGLLTAAGKAQIFRLGQWVRERYSKLLVETPYESDVLQAQSTVSDRTISSAQIFLAGLYPPSENEKWLDGLDWQPIPVYSTPKQMDKMLLFEKYCSRYNLEIMRVNNSPELLAYHEQYKRVFRILKEEAGVKFDDGDLATAINEVVHIRDNLMIDDRNELPLPAWSKTIYPKDLTEMSKMFFKIQTYNLQMKRLKGGLLVKNMIDDMLKRRDDPASKKCFQIYSGHDTTIAVLLNTLDLFDNVHPRYGAIVLVELREKFTEGVNEPTYYVTISYRNGDDAPLVQLEMPSCKNPCTLDSFIEATSELIPNDWEHECEYLVPDYNTILF